MSKTYAIGIDFGTESARAELVDLATGDEIATAVYAYADGVIDERLPGTQVRLEPDWALQNPQDYVRAVQDTVPRILAESHVSLQNVIGIGIDFTACTMLPTKADAAQRKGGHNTANAAESDGLNGPNEQNGPDKANGLAGLPDLAEPDGAHRAPTL